jgi:hypothetical protein
MDFILLIRRQTKGSAIKDFAMSFCRKPLARNDRFCFQNSKIGFGTLVSYPRKTFDLKLVRLTKS